MAFNAFICTIAFESGCKPILIEHCTCFLQFKLKILSNFGADLLFSDS